ncbi:uncharacterized protein LOC132290649, partial [Cornus florida]|uniref:uncharacterized protein LOC132290649 n=1 Tax=Cornus florida TaxID=4283 RepID=UPI002898B460
LLAMEMNSLLESDWAWLPKDLLATILDKLVLLSDYVRFGVVCKEWQYVVMENKVEFLQKKCCRQVPFLMVPTEDNREERRSLYSITHNKLYDFQLRLPPIMDRAEFDHVEDYIDIDPEIGYYDTTPVEDEVDFEVMKATVSADPVLSPNDYIPGDKAWTYIDRERFFLIHDVIYYKDNIFAVGYWSRIIMVDLNKRVGESMAAQVKVIAPKTDVVFDRTYLVESSRGDLLLVQRNMVYDEHNDCKHETTGFKVFKLLLEQLEQGLPKRVEMKGLDGDAMFLGDNHSICISASKWPGCQPNSIYYTDDYIDLHFHPPCGRRDNGIFNVESGSFGTHYTLDPSHNHMPPSIWILPTMLGN